jgi:hypothetical protein
MVHFAYLLSCAASLNKLSLPPLNGKGWLSMICSKIPDLMEALHLALRKVEVTRSYCFKDLLCSIATKGAHRLASAHQSPRLVTDGEMKASCALVHALDNWQTLNAPSKRVPVFTAVPRFDTRPDLDSFFLKPSNIDKIVNSFTTLARQMQEMQQTPPNHDHSNIYWDQTIFDLSTRSVRPSFRFQLTELKVRMGLLLETLAADISNINYLEKHLIAWQSVWSRSKLRIPECTRIEAGIVHRESMPYVCP